MMKRYVITCMLIYLCTAIYAKKVKFAVDMIGQTVSSTGVHVTGDFQTVAGFSGGNWQANTTLLTQETGTSTYSIVVNIPAFKKYEYKFLNGDQFYNVEFVPVESRVGYDFNDNRWIYVDSLANDTTYVGAILFSGNAPQGKKLLKFKVDVQNQTSVNTTGIHVAGDFQGWDPAKTRMYSFSGSVYEIIAYPATGNYQFKYYYGNNAESVPTACATSSNRSINLTKDTVFETVCFSQCGSCTTTEISKIKSVTAKLYPNPAISSMFLEFNDQSISHDVTLYDASGHLVKRIRHYTDSSIIINRGNLASGVYYLTSEDSSGLSSNFILIFE